jgi:hypothetical protein
MERREVNYPKFESLVLSRRHEKTGRARGECAQAEADTGAARLERRLPEEVATAGENIKNAGSSRRAKRWRDARVHNLPEESEGLRRGDDRGGQGWRRVVGS